MWPTEGDVGEGGRENGEQQLRQENGKSTPAQSKTLLLLSLNPGGRRLLTANVWGGKAFAWAGAGCQEGREKQK